MALQQLAVIVKSRCSWVRDILDKGLGRGMNPEPLTLTSPEVLSFLLLILVLCVLCSVQSQIQYQEPLYVPVMTFVAAP